LHSWDSLASRIVLFPFISRFWINLVLSLICDKFPSFWLFYRQLGWDENWDNMDQKRVNFLLQIKRDSLTITFSLFRDPFCFFWYRAGWNEVSHYGVLYCSNLEERPSSFHLICLTLSTVPGRAAESLLYPDSNDSTLTIVRFFSLG
jgi:hypothetical protein